MPLFRSGIRVCDEMQKRRCMRARVRRLHRLIELLEVVERRDHPGVAWVSPLPIIERAFSELRVVHEIVIRNRALVIPPPEHVDPIADAERAEMHRAEIPIGRRRYGRGRRGFCCPYRSSGGSERYDTEQRERDDSSQHVIHRSTVSSAQNGEDVVHAVGELDDALNFVPQRISHSNRPRSVPSFLRANGSASSDSPSSTNDERALE